MLMMCCFSWIS